MNTSPRLAQGVLTTLLAGAALGSAVSVAADARPLPDSSNAERTDWLSVSGSQRTRYEILDGQFRAGRAGGDQMLAFRTTLRLEARFTPFSIVGELMDSRQALADSNTPIDTTMVNAVEPLQGYVAIPLSGAFVDEGRSELRIGRQTLDVGSRRLVARNQFRNTVNAFTGVHYQWEQKDGPTVRALYVLPVTRLPSDIASLLDNDIELDEEHLDVRFWGVHVHWPTRFLDATSEAFVFGLQEKDSNALPTRNREIYTPGLRVSRKPTSKAWDFDFESAIQFGSLRDSGAATDQRDLDHFAYFAHVELGYTFAASASPRVAVLYDFASGDDSPTDDDSNRFDTLFGARRFDHGPTGIYGAFARSNIQSPGVRISAKPHTQLDGMFAYRAYWLASDTDAWTTSGLRDASGNSGSFIGHQVEARLRWDLRHESVRLELGGAYLFAGEFIRSAPNATGQGDTAYGYFAVDLSF
ncbi:MAG TPA: alginate export family protein [Nitrospiraceae bacterium]|nr:alginate export family protein [Nitrospiraceae bacterium]